MGNLTNKTVIKSVSYSQDEILKNIMKLYVPEGFDLDPTYSVGNFYKKIPQPKYKMDIDPVRKGVIQADSTDLPLSDESINSIIFDPPFLATIGNVAESKKKSNIIIKRFGYYKNMNSLWTYYKKSLKEFYRVLKYKGFLVCKIQDSISSSKQYLSHVELINAGIHFGFYPKDIFILLSKNVILSPKHSNQQHARKFHSYFVVFCKERLKVNYTYVS
jgi:hypothetical protein